MLRYFIRSGVHDACVHVGARVLRPYRSQNGHQGGKHTRRIITPVPFPPAFASPSLATTINLWRVMAQARFCLNGQPYNSWTRVTAGTPMRLESWRGCLRQFSVNAEKDDGGTARRSPCLSERKYVGGDFTIYKLIV